MGFINLGVGTVAAITIVVVVTVFRMRKG